MIESYGFGVLSLLVVGLGQLKVEINSFKVILFHVICYLSLIAL